jgi:hypothetical protein
LPLPYGQCEVVNATRSYGSLQDEALKISVSLLPVQDAARAGAVTRCGTPADPIPLIKNVCQAVRGSRVFIGLLSLWLILACSVL